MVSFGCPASFGCSGGLSGFVSAVPVVSVVGVVSFRRFRFGISRFSTCRLRKKSGKRFYTI